MNDVLFRDTLLNMLLGMVGVATILMLALVVVVKSDNESAVPPGNLAITVCWPEGATDVDTWVMAPGDNKPVGYSNRGSRYLNLLRDDLGLANDTMPTNCENVFSRGLPDGEYTINVHAFKTPVVPVPVSVEVRIGDHGGHSQKAIERTVTLVREGQEITVARFRLQSGKIVQGSLNNTFKALRGAK